MMTSRARQEFATIRTIRYSLFRTIRYSRLFAIHYSGFTDTRRPETSSNISHRVLLQEREFISQRTQTHYNNNYAFF